MHCMKFTKLFFKWFIREIHELWIQLEIREGKSKSEGNFHTAPFSPLMKNKCMSLSGGTFYWYLSTSFFLPSEKIFFRLPHLHRLLFGAPKLYASPSHHALWLVKIHSWCLRLPPLVLTGFLGHFWSSHPLFWCVFGALCWWATRSAFICCTCSSRFKTFYPLRQLSLIHGVCYILHQHPTMDFHRFDSLCPQNEHYDALFLDDWVEHPCHMTNMECCAQLVTR